MQDTTQCRASAMQQMNVMDAYDLLPADLSAEQHHQIQKQWCSTCSWPTHDCVSGHSSGHSSTERCLSECTGRGRDVACACRLVSVPTL